MEKWLLSDAFEARMRHTLGGEFDEFRKSLQQESPVSIRLNPSKPMPAQALQPVPWCKSGFYLPERPLFTLDPHFHAGAYYVQEASSMFLEQLVLAHVDLSRPLRVLDLCAAPGGKSTHLVSLLPEGSLLVSNEVIRTRASILSENMQKWGYPNVVVTNNDPRDFQRLEGFFDVIVLDAPCSGEGLFRKEPEAMNEWSTENVRLCSLRQRRILGDVWPSLREGGLVIYSTCTYNEEENGNNLKWLAENHGIESCELSDVPSGIQRVIVDGITGYQFYPHRLMGEGFFIAGVRKKGEQSERHTRSAGKPKVHPAMKEAAGWVTEDFAMVLHEDLLIGWPSALTNSIELLSQHLHVVTKGTAIATVKHNKLVPEHALALSTRLREDAFPKLEVDRDQAIRFLRKETWVPVQQDRGFARVVFEGSSLGWVNLLGNRINNLYPSNWRIRMGQ